MSSLYRERLQQLGLEKYENQERQYLSGMFTPWKTNFARVCSPHIAIERKYVVVRFSFFEGRCAPGISSEKGSATCRLRQQLKDVYCFHLQVCVVDDVLQLHYTAWTGCSDLTRPALRQAW